MPKCMKTGGTCTLHKNYKTAQIVIMMMMMVMMICDNCYVVQTAVMTPRTNSQWAE